MHCNLIEMAYCVFEMNLQYKKLRNTCFGNSNIPYLPRFFVFIKSMLKENVTSYDIPPAPYVIVVSCD